MQKSFKKTLALILSIVMIIGVLPMGLSFAAESDYTYTIADDKATITKYTGSDEEVVVPGTLDGYTVVAIAEKAFRDNLAIKKIKFADSIETIGNLAFYKCQSLVEVNLGNGVKTLNGAVFSNCQTIDTVIIGKSLTSVGTGAFNGTTVNKVLYKGSEAEWAAISIGESNNRFTSAEIVFNYCEHEIVEVPEVAAECEKTGNIQYWTCTLCNKNYSDANATTEIVDINSTVIKKAGHKIIFTGPDTITVITPPTCTEEGVGSAYCHRCEKDINVRLSEKGHDPKVNPKIPATCTTDGKEAETVCKTCNEILEAGAVISRTGHKLSELEKDIKVVNAPTCTATGLNKVLCTVCNEKIDVVVAMLPHSVSEALSKEPTCTETGYKGGKWCTVCKKEFVAPEIIGVLGHDFVVDESLTVNPDCDTAGSTVSKCSRCPEKKNDVINPLGHIIETVDGADATCTQAGYEDYEYCTRENCNYNTYEAIEVLGHTPGTPATCLTAQTCVRCEYVYQEALGHDVKIVSGKDVTCTANGLTDGEYCDRCKVVLKEQYTINTTGHKTEKVKGTPATCTEAGKTDGIYCTACETWVIPQAVIEALDHKKVKINAITQTCTEYGWTEGEGCENCDVIFDAPQRIDPYGHDIVPVYGKEATCTENGLTDGEKCSRCGYFKVEQEEIPAGHKLVYIEPLAPTCTEPGHTFGQKCSACKVFVIQPTEVPATGHTEGPAATCAAAQTCTVCNAVLAAALAHTPGAAATCLNPQVCTVCNGVLVEALGHELVFDPAVNKPVTCYSDGYEKGDCKNCDYSYSKTIPATGHNVETWTVIILPTCKEEGKAVGLCMNCKHTMEDKVPVVDHKDELGNDNKCDFCGKSMGGITLPDFGGNDKEDEGKCSCNCHAVGIKGLIFDFILFLQRLFGFNRVCKCGEPHYD